MKPELTLNSLMKLISGLSTPFSKDRIPFSREDLSSLVWISSRRWWSSASFFEWLTLFRISLLISKALWIDLYSSVSGDPEEWLQSFENMRGYLVSRCITIGIISWIWSLRQTESCSASCRNAFNLGLFSRRSLRALRPICCRAQQVAAALLKFSAVSPSNYSNWNIGNNSVRWKVCTQRIAMLLFVVQFPKGVAQYHQLADFLFSSVWVPCWISHGLPACLPNSQTTSESILSGGVADYGWDDGRVCPLLSNYEHETAQYGTVLQNNGN